MSVPAYPYVGDPYPHQRPGWGHTWTSTTSNVPLADRVTVTCEECGMTFSTVSSPLDRGNAEETCLEWLDGHRERRHNAEVAE